ncbi:MAG: hypothetical protein JXX14_11915 [Deltaproteobacteria bacterium]|nr:hypothetical protein [Deltaproteobacteria bacterium]
MTNAVTGCRNFCLAVAFGAWLTAGCDDPDVYLGSVLSNHDDKNAFIDSDAVDADVNDTVTGRPTDHGLRGDSDNWDSDEWDSDEWDSDEWDSDEWDSDEWDSDNAALALDTNSDDVNDGQLDSDGESADTSHSESLLNSLLDELLTIRSPSLYR